MNIRSINMMAKIRKAGGYATLYAFWIGDRYKMIELLSGKRKSGRVFSGGRNTFHYIIMHGRIVYRREGVTTIERMRS